MYSIPFANGIIVVDCRWKSYDPDRFEIYSMEWEVGITIPKCVWWNLKIYPEQMARTMLHMRYDNYIWFEYIHEYIFRWMCAFEPVEEYD